MAARYGSRLAVMHASPFRLPNFYVVHFLPDDAPSGGLSLVVTADVWVDARTGAVENGGTVRRASRLALNTIPKGV